MWFGFEGSGNALLEDGTLAFETTATSSVGSASATAMAARSPAPPAPTTATSVSTTCTGDLPMALWREGYARARRLQFAILLATLPPDQRATAVTIW